MATLEKQKAEQGLKLGLCEGKLSSASAKLAALREREVKLLEENRRLRQAHFRRTGGNLDESLSLSLAPEPLPADFATTSTVKAFG